MVLAIGPDPHEQSRAIAEAHRLEYGLLYDRGLLTAKKYGALIEGPQPLLKYEEGMPLPMTFLIDRGGVARFTSRNTEQGIRYAPDAILPIREALLWRGQGHAGKRPCPSLLFRAAMAVVALERGVPLAKVIEPRGLRAHQEDHPDQDPRSDALSRRPHSRYRAKFLNGSYESF